MRKFYQDPAAYLKKPIYKDYFNTLKRIIKNEKIKKVLDIGCGPGHLSSFMPKDLDILGIDINNKLLRVAKKNNKNKNKEFRNINLFDCSKKKLQKKIKRNNLLNYDLITLFGTINILNNIENVIQTICKLRAKKIIMNGTLNDYGYDMTINYEKNSNKEKNFKNIYSKELVSYLFKKNNHKLKFIKYKMKSTLTRSKKDPLRKYHIILKNGKKILTSALDLMENEYLIIATKK